MDPEDRFSGMDAEQRRRGILRTLRAMFPDRVELDPDDQVGKELLREDEPLLEGEILDELLEDERAGDE